MSTRVVGTGTALVLGILAALHVYWAFRGTGGSAAIPTRLDGTPLFRPGPLASLLVAAALAAAGGIALARSGAVALPGPPAMYRAGAWLVSLVFALRVVGEFHFVGLFKTVTGTPFARLDTILFTPLCAVLALAALYLARS